GHGSRTTSGAIGKTIEALRGIARWGMGDMMERAFQGFEALPDPEQWWHTLGYLSPADVVSAEDIETRYRKLAAQRHPDRGGSDEVMAKLNRARERAYAHSTRQGSRGAHRRRRAVWSNQARPASIAGVGGLRETGVRG